MSPRPETVILQFAFGKDPLDDPLNASWDAAVRPGQDISPQADPDDVAFLRRVHALEEVSLPSPTFFGELERRLAGMYPSLATSPESAPWVKGVRPAGIAQPAPKRRGLSPRTHRLFSMQGALAALAIMLIASLFVLFQAVPKSSETPAIPAATVPQPTVETMVRLDFAPSLLGIPDATTWNHMNFNLIQLDPGKSFSTDVDWYTLIDGPLLIMVASGELTIHPDGPALFYPAERRDQTPVDIPSGQTVSLGPNDAIAYSSVDSATGSNPGSDPTVALLGNIGNVGPGHGSSTGPIDIKNLDSHYAYEMHAPPTAGASISIRRLQLAPFDSFVFEPDRAWTYLCVFDQFRMTGVRMADGAVDGFSPEMDTQRLYSSRQLTYPDSGPHTIFNLGDETVDIYFLVVEPAPDLGSPAP